QATGVSIASRRLERGVLFVALNDRRDGHDFVADALQKGAAAAMVSRVPPDVAQDAPLLVVPEVLEGLRALGGAARARAAAQVVAITGSVGKTSTKDMLRLMLAAQGRAHAAQNSFNNHWGVPLDLARLPPDADFAVLEIGMNHPGEISPLARLVRPDIALITEIAPAHLQAFADINAIAREKAAIFDGLQTGGVAVINADLPPEIAAILLAAAKKAKAEILRFGAHPDADFRLVSVRLVDDRIVVQATHSKGELLFKVMSAGRHFAHLALGALAAVHALGADVTIAANDLAQWRPGPGRGMRETVFLDAADDRLTLSLLDDAYNANPASMAAALAVLAASQPCDDVGRVRHGRRIAVLGDMLELGANAVQMHKDLARLEAMNAIDTVHCVGPDMHELYRELAAHQRGEWRETAAGLADEMHRHVDAGDIILVKGSQGSRVSIVVDAIRKLGHPQAQTEKGKQ
ncbi:MAG: UDP-N-acetylmuramoyl-tripeptide--D-alanyl-D-alanine ligase, partial [Paracoccaceae bacterium]